ERDNRLNRLRAVSQGQRGALTNARCLAEGADVPTLDGVAFIEPRRSQVDIVQAVGRAIRKARDKTVGTVVIPVFVDEDADAERALESGEFDRVWQVVKALVPTTTFWRTNLTSCDVNSDGARPAATGPGRSGSICPWRSETPSPAPSTRDLSKLQPR